jgi:hypothetical protein
MISRKLLFVLLGSGLLAWLSYQPSSPATAYVRPAPLATTSPAATPPQPALEPWRRLIELPAIEPMPISEPEVLVEPIALAEVEPPAPEPPSAPPLPVQYLGRLHQADAVVLYIRYQEQAQSIKIGERLGDDYRLERIAKDHALFRYLPLDSLQELRWDEQP